MCRLIAGVIVAAFLSLCFNAPGRAEADESDSFLKHISQPWGGAPLPLPADQPMVPLQPLPANPPPNYALAYKVQGLAWLAVKNWDAAMDYLSASLLVNATQADAYALRGYAWLQKKEYAKAAADLDRATLLDPHLACAYYWRAQVANAKWVAQNTKLVKEWQEATAANEKADGKSTAAKKAAEAAQKVSTEAAMEASKAKAAADAAAADLAPVQAQWEEANRTLARAVACCDPICFRNAKHFLDDIQGWREKAKKTADVATAGWNAKKDAADKAAAESTKKATAQDAAATAATDAKTKLQAKADALDAMALELQQAICGCEKGARLAPACAKLFVKDCQAAKNGLDCLKVYNFKYTQLDCPKCP